MKKLIIFIHGLNDSEKSWTNREGKRFGDLLLSNPAIEEKYDIEYYDYKEEASVFSKLGIEKHGKILKTWLTAKTKKYEEVILVCYSTGGLLAKYVILNEKIREKIKLYISLAVPHKGSYLENIKMFKNIGDLSPYSSVVNELEKDWIKKYKVLPKTLYVTGEYDDVVPNVSSSGLEAPEREGFYEEYSTTDNHKSISRPKDKEELIYILIESELEDFNVDNADSDNNPRYKIESLDFEKIKESLDSELFNNLERKLKVVFNNLSCEDEITNSIKSNLILYQRGKELLDIICNSDIKTFEIFQLTIQNFLTELIELKCGLSGDLEILKTVRIKLKERLKESLNEKLELAEIETLANSEIARWLLFCDLDFRKQGDRNGNKN